MDTIFNIYARIQEESKQSRDVGWSGVKMRDAMDCSQI